MRYIIFALVLLWVTTGAMAQPFKISEGEALKIAIKIWYNESHGSILGLTAWNEGEHFASLGIGHFIWYPREHYGHEPFDESFPALVQYMEARGVTVPDWLAGGYVPYCPWRNRRVFLAAQNSVRMQELREFLLATVSQQAAFMAHRLEHALPNILAHASKKQRPVIRREFRSLARTTKGLYALVDYLNFKGEGLVQHNRSYGRGWGLLEVLEDMRLAPRRMTPTQAFVWAADRVLTARVRHEPSGRDEKRWLPGWRNRLHTYL